MSVDRDVGRDRGVALRELLEDRDGVETAEARCRRILVDVDAAEPELAGTVERLPREQVLLVALGGVGGELGLGELADGRR